MKMQLQKVLYKKINSIFNIEENMPLQIRNTFSLNVNYTNDNKNCYATMSITSVEANNPDIFKIELELVGMFICDGIKNDVDKQYAHVQVYNYLFPYAQATIADLTNKAGLPPLMIDMAIIDPKTVNINK